MGLEVVFNVYMFRHEFGGVVAERDEFAYHAGGYRHEFGWRKQQEGCYFRV